MASPERPDPRSLARRAAIPAVVLLGIALRVALTWRNPPLNGYDDHFEPVYLLLTGGRVPDKFACFQCYHPPLFYGVQASIGWLLEAAGLAESALKVLQYVNCLFGIGSLLIATSIVRHLPVGFHAQLAAASIAAFLPRHVYLSAAHSNDSLVVLLATGVVWLLLRLIELEGEGSWPL